MIVTSVVIASRRSSRKKYRYMERNIGAVIILYVHFYAVKVPVNL